MRRIEKNTAPAMITMCSPEIERMWKSPEFAERLIGRLRDAAALAGDEPDRA